MQFFKTKTGVTRKGDMVKIKMTHADYERQQAQLVDLARNLASCKEERNSLKKKLAPFIGAVSTAMTGAPTARSGFRDTGESAWTKHNTPEGREYYYNPSTGDTQWEQPGTQVQNAGGGARIQKRCSRCFAIIKTAGGKKRSTKYRSKKNRSKNRKRKGLSRSK